MGNAKSRIDESHGSDATLYNAVCTVFKATAFTSELVVLTLCCALGWKRTSAKHGGYDSVCENWLQHLPFQHL